MKCTFYSLIPNLLNKFFNSYYILSISLGYDGIRGPPRTYRLMRETDPFHNVTNGTIKLYTRHSRSIKNTGEEECMDHSRASWLDRQTWQSYSQVPFPTLHLRIVWPWLYLLISVLSLIEWDMTTLTSLGVYVGNHINIVEQSIFKICI